MGGKFLVGHSGLLARASKHSSIAGLSSQLMARFLQKKIEGTMLICIGTDSEDQLVPLSFAIV